MSVYYIHAPEMEMVKIGFASRVAARLSQIRVHSPARLVLLAIEQGGREVEALRHEQFAGYRARGEWFVFCGELKAFIEALPPLPVKQLSPFAAMRKALGLSQVAMAAALDLNQSTISRFETGELPLDKRTLLAAQALLAKTDQTRAA